MKRYEKILALAVICLDAVILSSCGHNHTWVEATCDAPKTCSECGETEGEALEHEWIEATCETARTCSHCGKTEGEALGHEWIEATFEAPQTCSVCGATMGEKYTLEVNVNPVEYVDTYTSEYINEEMEKVAENHMYLVGSDYSDGHQVVYFVHRNINNGIYTLYSAKINEQGQWTEKKAICLFYNLRCSIVNGYSFFEIQSERDVTDYEYILIDDEMNKIAVDEKCKLNLMEDNDSNICVIDHKWCINNPRDNKAYTLSEGNWVEDNSIVDMALMMSQEGIKHCYNGIIEKNGKYYDKNKNELASFKMATTFDKNGYAIVSDDGVNFSIIDSEFNIIASNILTIEDHGNDPDKEIKTDGDRLDDGDESENEDFITYYFADDKFLYSKKGDADGKYELVWLDVEIVGGPGDGVITPGEVVSDKEVDQSEDSADTNIKTIQKEL